MKLGHAWVIDPIVWGIYNHPSISYLRAGLACKIYVSEKGSRGYYKLEIQLTCL